MLFSDRSKNGDEKGQFHFDYAHLLLRKLRFKRFKLSHFPYVIPGRN